MIVDEELLKKTKAAEAALAEAQRNLELARAEFHTSIRRLHLASGSLREVARAIGISHQRVQQIVDGAGGTWWSRIWRSRTVKRDTVCTFCERLPSEVESLVAGPNVFICGACTGLAERALTGLPSEQPALHLPDGQRRKPKCSFCGKQRTQSRMVVTGNAAHICQECLQMCRQILTDRSGGAASNK